MFETTEWLQESAAPDRGSRGYLKWLQAQLNRLEGAGLVVDGRFGPMTRDAIRAFQAKYLLAGPPDGVPSAMLDAALMMFGAPPPQPDPPPHGGAPNCRSASKTFTPANKDDLVDMRGFDGRTVKLHRLAFLALHPMIITARVQGIAAPLLLPSQGLRSIEEQERTWARALARHGGDEAAARVWVCKPAPTCPHLSGLAVDLWLGSRAARANVALQRKTAAYRWLVDNAHHFGFRNLCAEPWHWEYQA